jgi:raffinose/stachyose/melibiose transport system permease protein
MTVNVSVLPRKRSGFMWTSLLTYGVALAVAGVSIGPVIYAILGGFRSNAQINAHRPACPAPGSGRTTAPR